MKVGDVVAPRQGGNLMTVEKINGDKASCVWFVENQLYRGEFDTKDLGKWVRECQKRAG